MGTKAKTSPICALLLVVVVSATYPIPAQTTVSTGSIVGVIVDSSEAVVSGAHVNISNIATGQVIELATNLSGAFNSGALSPGDYKVLVSAKGFSSTEETITVLIGNTTTANVRLRIGSGNEVIEVQDSAVRANTEQPSVQGVLNEQQIETLPVNGRNFLELAQLEPGVQIQDAANFSLGKDGFSSVSFGGRFGRTTRIEVDGIDVSDEIFGSTTTNIAASAIQEFQLSQSSHDLSTELTTSGAINVTTRSGTNSVHGGAFEFFRDSSLAAALPRSQLAITAGASRVAPDPLCLHAVATTTAGPMELIRSFLLHRRRPSPHYSWVGSCIISFVACLAFTRVTTCRLAKSPYATLYTGGSDGFVISTAAPIATGRSDPVPGRVFPPAVVQRLSRRTVMA